jgi:uracil-DNA glycosylase
MKTSEEFKQEALEVISALRSYVEEQQRLGIKIIPACTPAADEWKVPRPIPPHLKKDALQSIREEIGDCTRCRLHAGRKNIVFGVGNPDARLVFVGEGPGVEEDQQAEPFVGKAGHLLTRMIQAIQLDRADVYIANIVKCRPPGNRDPQEDEIETCLPFLKKQLAVIQPGIICTLGRFATQALLGTKEGITKLRGRFHVLESGIKVMPTYHPSFLLRYPEKKREAWEDLQKVQKEYQAGSLQALQCVKI